MAADEVLDLVNNADVVIGSMERGAVYAKGLSNIRGANGFLRNSKGEIWLQRRSVDKSTYPGAWDTSVGGHVSSGEDYNTAFARELKEELNLDLEKIQWRVLGDMQPYRHGITAFLRLYEITTDETPSYNIDDISEGEWMSVEDILKLEVGVGKATPHLLNIVDYFYNPDGSHKQLPRDRVVGLVFNPHGEIFLMKRQKAGKEFWVFPGGGWDAGESLPEAVAREMSEEGSLKTSATDLAYGVSFNDGSYHYFCSCEAADGELALQTDSVEVEKMAKSDNQYWPQWVSVDKLPNLLLYPTDVRDLLVKDLREHAAPQNCFIKQEIAGGLLKMAGASKT